MYCSSYHVLNLWFYYFLLNLVAKNKSYWNDFLKIIFLNINLIIQYSYINARLYCMYNMLIKITNFVLKIILWNWITLAQQILKQHYKHTYLFSSHIKILYSYQNWYSRVEGVWACISVWHSLTSDYFYGYLIVHKESWCCCILRWSITWG